MISPRSKIFMEELPKNGNKMLPSALKAGYSESYARARGKKILQTAIKESAKEVLRQVEDKSLTPLQGKKLMSEIVGLSREDIMKQLVFIATQERDLASALKVLAPLSREHGVTLQAEEAQSVTVPILNVVVEKQNTEPDTQQVETTETTPLIE